MPVKIDLNDSNFFQNILIRSDEKEHDHLNQEKYKEFTRNNFDKTINIKLNMFIIFLKITLYHNPNYKIYF